MKFCSTAVLSALVLLGQGVLAQTPAQAPAPTKPAKAGKAATGKSKDSLEAQFARQNFKQVLDAVNKAWFGEALQRGQRRGPGRHPGHQPHRRRHERQGRAGWARAR